MAASLFLVALLYAARSLPATWTFLASSSAAHCFTSASFSRRSAVFVAASRARSAFFTSASKRALSSVLPSSNAGSFCDEYCLLVVAVVVSLLPYLET